MLKVEVYKHHIQPIKVATQKLKGMNSIAIVNEHLMVGAGTSLMCVDVRNNNHVNIIDEEEGLRPAPGRKFSAQDSLLFHHHTRMYERKRDRKREIGVYKVIVTMRCSDDGKTLNNCLQPTKLCSLASPVEYEEYYITARRHELEDKLTELIILIQMPNKSEIRLFNGKGKPINVIEVPGLSSIGGVCAAADDCILVTDCVREGRVVKYQVESKRTLKQVWTCDRLELPTSICVSSEGYILVASMSQPRIYILSPDGMCSWV